MQERGCRSTPVLDSCARRSPGGRLSAGASCRGRVGRASSAPRCRRLCGRCTLGRETPRGQLPTSRSCPGPRPYGRGRRGSGLTLRCPRRPPPWGPVHILPLPSASPESPRRTLLWRRVWPPNRLQSSGPSSQGRGISWPLPEACRALAGGEKDTLHCPADPRTPANVRQEVRRPPLRRPFVSWVLPTFILSLRFTPAQDLRRRAGSFSSRPTFSGLPSVPRARHIWGRLAWLFAHGRGGCGCCFRLTWPHGGPAAARPASSAGQLPPRLLA